MIMERQKKEREEMTAQVKRYIILVVIAQPLCTWSVYCNILNIYWLLVFKNITLKIEIKSQNAI